MAAMDGSCECGAVRYRMNGAPIFVNCCHCRDCQKITGSAFALNAMIEADRIEIIKGEESIVSGADAARCATCQTLLWAEHRLFGDSIRFLRVGTLDEAEQITPDAHFFVRSKHPWVTVPPQLPAFETLPGEEDPPLLDEAAAARL